MFAHPSTHLARPLVDDRLRAQRDSHSQRSLVEASLLIVGDRRRPGDHGRR
jgi:hypothetical protein